MKHRVGFRKLQRKTEHRLAMLRNMVTSLVHHDRIETTVAKAKELRRYADKVITIAKKDNEVRSRQLAQAVLRDEKSVNKLFDELKPRYKDRAGGYTRVLKTTRRVGDGAEMAVIEFVDRSGELRKARKPLKVGLAAEF